MVARIMLLVEQREKTFKIVCVGKELEGMFLNVY